MGKGLARRPMVFIGLISYSLYLWHWPVLVFSKYWTLGAMSLGQRLLLLLASWSWPILSWKFVEVPFRKRQVLKTRTEIFAFAGATTAVLCLAGIGVYRLQGLPSRIPSEALHYLEGSKGADTANSAPGQELTLADALKGNFNELGSGDRDLPVSLVVWGDSHAKVLGPVLDSLCRGHSIRGLMAAHSQTAPLIGYESRGEWSLKGTASRSTRRWWSMFAPIMCPMCSWSRDGTCTWNPIKEPPTFAKRC